MLSDIRKVIDKYNFPPEYKQKIELMACDIYDLVFKAKFKVNSNCIFKNDVAEEKLQEARIDGLRNPLSIAVKDIIINESLFIPYSGYDHKSDFYSYAHNIVKSHSIIKIKSVPDGWVITKIKNI